MLAAADVRKTRLGKVLFLLILSYVLSTFFYKVKYFIRDEGQAQMRHRKQTLLWACLEYICNVSIVFLLQETWWRWVHVPAGKTSQGINSMTWKTGPPFGFRLFDAIGARPGFYARSFLAYTYVASYFFYLVSMILLQVNTDILLPSAAGINGTRIAIMETTTNTYEIFFIACHTWAALSTSMICADFLFAVSYHRNFRKSSRSLKGVKGKMTGQLNDQSKLMMLVSFMTLVRSGLAIGVYVFDFCPYKKSDVDSRGDPHERPLIDSWACIQNFFFVLIFLVDQFPRHRGAFVTRVRDECKFVKTRSNVFCKVTSFIVAGLFLIFDRSASLNGIFLTNRVLYVTGFFFSVTGLSKYKFGIASLAVMSRKSRNFIRRYETPQRAPASMYSRLYLLHLRFVRW